MMGVLWERCPERWKLDNYVFTCTRCGKTEQEGKGIDERTCPALDEGKPEWKPDPSKQSEWLQ